MRSVRVRLWRWRPPFCRTVAVRPITVRGFLDLVRVAARRAAEVRTLAGKDITGEDIIRAMREPEFLAFADAVTRAGSAGSPEAGFLGRWLSHWNVAALLRASAAVNDWPRFLGCLNLTGKRNRGGSLIGDVQAICRLFPGLDPMRMQDEWAMEDFLNFCDALNVREAPTERDDDMATLAMMPGIEVVQ